MMSQLGIATMKEMVNLNLPIIANPINNIPLKSTYHSSSGYASPSVFYTHEKSNVYYVTNYNISVMSNSAVREYGNFYFNKNGSDMLVSRFYIDQYQKVSFQNTLLIPFKMRKNDYLWTSVSNYGDVAVNLQVVGFYRSR